ncbi:MAG: hypothetical protein RMK20_13970, partial [Verrucomicrobiales bacterium]|nr:hypothetical protein [Verrucomicrobiales bacterium]
MRALVAGLTLVVATVLAYAPVFRAGFIWDDDFLVTANPLVTSPDGLRDIWFSTRPVDYFPLTLTSLWVEWKLWGLNPTGYHVTNVLLHAASALVLWRLLRRLAIPGAWWAALLFALHPVNIESVAWIAQRKNTLCMVFFLLSVWAYVRYLQGVEGRGSKVEGRGTRDEG